MFVEPQFLKEHLHRHGAEKLQKTRDYYCTFCPVTCTSEAHLQRHVDREHASTEMDMNFTLHENCLSCEAMYKSYLQNKATLSIPDEELAFKCPHCCTILFAHQKHAPRYLKNHVNKFHWDESVNDFTLKGLSPEEYKVRSRVDPDLFTCDFCGVKSDSREDHNEHLALCPANTSTSKPGYMCDTCGLIAGTARLLKHHLNTSHNKPKEEKVLKVIGRKSKTQTKAASDGGEWLEESSSETSAQGKRKRGRPPKNKNLQSQRQGTGGSRVSKKSTNPLRVECEECPMDFKREEDMLAHSVIHKGKIMCPIHNIMFKLEAEVFQHVNQADPKDKFAKLVCCMCGDSFKHMCIYMKHLRRHLNISPYDCPLCGKGFRVYDTLQSHLARVHGQGNEDKSTRWFHCDQCSKSFLTRGHLREHILGMHDKSEMFYCPACSKTFQTKKRVQRHIYVAHKDIKEQYTTHRKLEVFDTQ
ncbi:zinc finger protein 425-like [Tigriopus californicus]|nr:zinc finger protein 425-like [Tigriopus californicus]